MEDLKSLSLAQVLERGAAQVSDKIAVVDGNQRKTYSELNAKANALAASLAEIGLKKGDRVAIYMKNSIELVVAFYAMQKLGVIVAWVNPIYRKAEVTLTGWHVMQGYWKNPVAPHKLPDELCIMEDFPKLSGGIKIKKFGKGGLAEIAEMDEKRERYRK